MNHVISLKAFSRMYGILLLGFLFFLLTVNLIPAQSVSPALSLKNDEIGDQDDMCIWIHPDPKMSTVISSDKDVNKLFVYDLQGNTIQSVDVAGRPANIDVRYNFPLSGENVDIVGFCDRDLDKIILLEVDPSTRQLTEVGNFDAGNWPDELYGFCMYHSPGTGKFYAIASGKSNQMRQWELVDNGDGTIGGVEKRTWMNGSSDKTEGLVADDETGKLYAANEGHGIYKYDADPTEQDPAGKLIAPTGENGLEDDVEGITLYYMADGEGYLIASSQGSDEYKVYERKEPHNFVRTFTVDGAESTDGIDVTNVNLGADFPKGIFVLHNGNSSPNEVLVCKYEDLGLQVDTTYWNPQNAGSPTSLDDNSPEPPSSFVLFRNYPNPFNPTTTIRYHLDKPGYVSLYVYDTVGRMVKRLVDNKYQTSGTKTVVWNAQDNNRSSLPSGIYHAVLKTNNKKGIIKLVLIR